MSAVPTPTEVTVRVTGYVGEDGSQTILHGIVMASGTHSVGGTEVTVSLDTAAASALLNAGPNSTPPANGPVIGEDPAEEPLLQEPDAPQELPESDDFVEDSRPSSTLGLVALVTGLGGFAVALGPRIFSVFGLALGLAGVTIGIIAAWKETGKAMGYAGFFFGITACFMALSSMTTMQDGLNEFRREMDSIFEDSMAPWETL